MEEERLLPEEMNIHLRLLEDLQCAQFAMDGWMVRVARAHGLRSGDQVTPDGRVVRAAEKEEEQNGDVPANRHERRARRAQA